MATTSEEPARHYSRALIFTACLESIIPLSLFIIKSRGAHTAACRVNSTHKAIIAAADY